MVRAQPFTWRRAAWLLVLVGTAPGVNAHAQQAPTTATAAIARADLADAYLRMDRAYASATLTDSVRAQVNKQFDRATLSFFAGRFAAAIATIDSATAVVTAASGQPAPSPEARAPREVNGRAPSAARDLYLARLAKLDSTGPLAQAIVSARARARLLVDSPSRERLAEWRSDPAQLARDLAREVGVLERGRNPYVGQAGDQWHTFRGDGGTLIPFRLVAPSAAATSRASVPLVVVLHGAGGDENMFPDAYGYGIVASMGMEANAIIASPDVNLFGSSPAHFDSLLSVLRSEYRVNDARIYVLGHSMGAGVAARLAQARPTTIAAVACLAGGTAVTVPKAPPILFVGAALDPVVKASAVKSAADKTPTATYRELEHEGHTLMVANGVRLALPWLLKHRP